MSGMLVIAGLVFGAYLYQPLWFDDTPYHHVSSHETLADCEKLLNDWRIKYTIAKGKNPQKKHKYDKELFNISFVK